MLKKEINYFDRDSSHFIQVQCHADAGSLDVSSFYNWIYSLKLDAKISSQPNFKEGFSTAHLNRFFHEVFSPNCAVIDFERIYTILLERDLLMNPRICSIVDKFMDFLIVDDVRMYSREEFHSLVDQDMELLEKKRVLKSIPYNTRVLSSISFDPFAKMVDQEILPKEQITVSKPYQYIHVFS